MLFMALFYLVSFWLGYEVILRSGVDRLLAVFLSVGAGLACTSFILSCSLLFGFGLQNFPLFWIHVIPAALLFFIRNRRSAHELTSGSDLLKSAAIAVILLLTVFFVSAVLFKSPFGNGVDVWAVWELKARFIYTDPTAWRKIFSPVLHYSHPDYPLLYPLSFVWGWLGAAQETPIAGWTLVFLTALSTTGLLIFGMGKRVIPAAFFAALFLMSTPAWTGMVSSLYADALLAYYVLCTGVLLSQITIKENEVSWLAPGFFAGSAMFVKNEGTLFFISVFLSVFLWILISRRPWKNFLSFSLGALPLAALAVLFKFFSNTPSHNLSGELAKELLHPSILAERSLWIFHGFFSQIFNENAWVYGWFVLFWIMIAFHRKVLFRQTFPVWLPVILLNLGYFAVYLQTPWGVKESLAASLDRLMIHSFPVLVFIAFKAWGETEK